MPTASTRKSPTRDDSPASVPSYTVGPRSFNPNLYQAVVSDSGIDQFTSLSYSNDRNRTKSRSLEKILDVLPLAPF